MRMKGKEQIKRFTDCFRDNLKKIGDIVLVGPDQSLVDIDIIIGILTDPNQKEDSL
jgi:hypothetical protein